MSNGAVRTVDADFRDWLLACFTRATRHFGLRVDGEAHYGWRLRSVSAPVRDVYDRAQWIRVVAEQERWLPGSFWTGNTEANVVEGIAKPVVLRHVEWSDSQWGNRRVRAEVMTRLPGNPCSDSDILRAPLTLSHRWWSELERSLAAIRIQHTERIHADQNKVDRRIRSAFGAAIRVRVDQWQTVHGDLHWANLRHPQFGLVDWELWGRGPAGLDEATLFCYSQFAGGSMSTSVHDRFAASLDSDAGRTAQLYVWARLLLRAQEDFPDLTGSIRSHANAILYGG